MAKLTLTDLSSLTNETSAINSINANNAAIEAAMELTLSRNGATPNQMTANLDMNSFQILNIPAPVDDYDLVRLIDVAEGIRGEKGDQGDPGGAVADGDYGDIVITGGGTVWTIDDDVITTPGRDFLSQGSISGQRAYLELGDSAVMDVGTVGGTVAGGNDARFYKYTVIAQNSSYTVAYSATSTPTILYHTSATPHVFAIDTVASKGYEIGSTINITNGPTAGAISLAREVGVALYANGSTTSADVSIAAGGDCSARMVANNIWYVSGSGIT